MASRFVVRAIPPFLLPPQAPTAGAELDTSELARAAAMAPAVRAVFVAGRLAQRRFAAELLGVPAGDLTASYRCPRCGPDAGHGRPGYTLAGVPAPLVLSLSRAAGWTLLAAVTDPAPGFLLGVDVEDPARTGFAGFAGVALTAAEQRAVAPLHGDMLLAAQARLWARKEAWLKMTGEGLRTSPAGLDVTALPGLADLAPARSGLPAHLAAAVARSDGTLPELAGDPALEQQA
ncbi:4-phosphopantetheinyl transferase [Arthrobacter sp. Leaf141]|uniref:4'-phosphopantetheinyl transferase family protein n=1 Tax=Micrococcaceae TaxID=1268 RepID=UPI0006F4D434|nr:MULTISPECIES: 4'-phosphopantetheinyl transferase family protein [Micrococcaceae]KQR03993.1 4-phosphopantetheinyl transferase [Arthrobacter sp. Leaf141]